MNLRSMKVKNRKLMREFDNLEAQKDNLEYKLNQITDKYDKKITELEEKAAQKFNEAQDVFAKITKIDPDYEGY